MIDQGSVPKQSLMLPKLKGDPGDPDSPPPTDPKLAKAQRLTRHLWVRELVAAYNQAHQARYGNPGFVKIPTDKKPVEFHTWDPVTGSTASPAAFAVAPSAADPAIETWKKYPVLLAAARALAEHEISPCAWAEWVMGSWAYARGVEHAFVASQVRHNARRAIFRKESGYGHGDGSKHAQPTQGHFEQLYRCRERDRLKRNPGIDIAKASIGFPPWYHELRLIEIKQGVTDPMDRFPAILKGAK